MNDVPRLEPVPAQAGTYSASGTWRIAEAAAGAACVAAVSGRATRIDATGIVALDSAGALLLLQAARQIGVSAAAVELRPEHTALFQAIAQALSAAPAEAMQQEPALLTALTRTGRAAVLAARNLQLLLGFLGQIVARSGASLRHPGRVPMTSIVYHMQRTGLDALPLVVLLSFLVGAVVAFLGATVLRDFGAELFVIDLTSYAFLREFGVLLTAILLAGRTASAFTAQIGTMKSREEVDAMRTLGLDPVDLLVLPRLYALLLMLPLLSVAATLAGIGGGMIVAWRALDIGPGLFMNHLHQTIELRHYLVGLGKAPIFALVIALVGCLEGFKVAGTAQSVGERTTAAVVQAITLVILIDAFAAIFFMEVGW